MTTEPANDPYREALHKLRYGMARATGKTFTADYIVNLIDTTTETTTGQTIGPCDRDHQYARAEAAEAALQRVRNLHHPVDYYGTLICASCSAYDGQGTCDNSPCGYEHCPTLAAINRTQESPRP